MKQTGRDKHLLQDYKHLAFAKPKQKKSQWPIRTLFVLLGISFAGVLSWQVFFTPSEQQKPAFEFFNPGNVQYDFSAFNKQQQRRLHAMINHYQSIHASKIAIGPGKPEATTDNQQTETIRSESSDSRNKNKLAVNHDTEKSKKPSHTKIAPTQQAVTKTKPTITPTKHSEAPAAITKQARDGHTHRWQSVIIEPGHTLNQIGIELQLPPSELALLLKTANRHAQHLVLKPGRSIRFRLDSNQRKLLSIAYRVQADKQFVLTRRENSFTGKFQSYKKKVKLIRVTGLIHSNLFDAGKKAAIPDALLLQLASIFSWDIDFSIDLRKGDKFSFLYQQHRAPNGKIEHGSIVAASITNAGKTWYALRYTRPDGKTAWYTRDAHSLKRKFIRTPLRLGRSTSTTQLQTGIKYSAAEGTPVKSTASGTIIFMGHWKGRKKHYGKTVIVRHARGYTTLYAHLSRFRKHLRKGSKVEQGQVIAYVGKTGATRRAQLHYELKRRGKHLNPLNAKLPRAKKLSARWRKDFFKKSAVLIQQLEQ